TADEWRDLIHRVCTDTLLLPSEKTRAELSMDVGEPSAAGRHTDVFSSVWHVVKIMTSLRMEVAGYRTAERLMRRSHSHSETVATGRDREPSVHSESAGVAGVLGMV
ncbi:hypothetical protein KI387_043312, partial [Taxus chinensis]